MLTKIVKILIFLLISNSIMAQNSDYLEGKIIVMGESRVDLPADKVVFGIILKYTDPADVEKAFSKHKTAEDKLLGFLKEAKIPAKDIQYSLITIGKNYVYDEVTQKNKYEFNTNQNVSICIYDIKQYAEFMMKLVSAGYTEVSTAFGSTKENNFHEALYAKALENATQKAEALAKASKLQIVKIATVTEGGNVQEPIMYASPTSKMMDASVGMTEIPQFISKTYAVKVAFYVK